MSFIIIDRRKNDKGKSTENRGKFIRRVKAQVKESVKDQIASGSIKDIGDGKSKQVVIPGKGLDRPTFSNSRKGGTRDLVITGNDRFIEGDRLKRPPDPDGEGGRNGSNKGEGNDDYQFAISQEEFLDIFFEDLELYDLSKKSIATTEEYEFQRAGFSTDGNKLNILRTMKTSKGRRIALRSKKKKKLKRMEEELSNLLKQPVLNEDEEKRIKKLERDIEGLRRAIKKVPFIDDIDLRYNRWEKVYKPVTKAVMFMLMDVSGSMGEREKDIAKRFFMTLYFFLKRQYSKVEVVFLRHHTIASEVDEDEFFYGRETGGTLVSPCLELMSDIIRERYPTNEWNIYGCQASDGDNYDHDTQNATDVLSQSILPRCQYYAYIQIGRRGRDPSRSNLWPAFKSLSEADETFNVAHIMSKEEIFEVFRNLFKKR